MDLNIFNSLNINNKGNDIIQGFIKELSEFLEKNITKNNLLNTNGKELSMIEQIQKNQKVTVKYRDKMIIERRNILNNYAKETYEKGTMYFIYDKNSRKENTYNVCICEEGKGHEIIEINKKDLPKEAEIDSVLRIENGKYVLDMEATEQISKKMTEMIDKLLQEQKQYLENNRIEGHIYEVGEKENDRVWLYDITKDVGEGIEEINFPLELLNKVTEGTKLKYENGNYQIYSNSD